MCVAGGWIEYSSVHSLRDHNEAQLSEDDLQTDWIRNTGGKPAHNGGFQSAGQPVNTAPHATADIL